MEFDMTIRGEILLYQNDTEKESINVVFHDDLLADTEWNGGII